MRYILFPITFPLSIIYGLITGLRNKLFDWGIMRELEFDVPLISIGNLAVGGTGKTPHIAYLLSSFSDKKIAVLSRGYGRKTSGYVQVESNSQSKEVGDEILMLKQSFKDVPMAVHEDRALGIVELLKNHPETELILLDDAFQHRHVKPGINVLLSEYKKPFYNDWLMPLGRLREWRKGYKRADVLVYTKCPDLSESDLRSERNAELEVPTLFSKIRYSELVQVHGEQQTLKNPLLLTSIARPGYLFDHLKLEFPKIEHKAFRDHYSFSQKDIEDLASRSQQWICTAKDWVKIGALDIPNQVSVWVQEIDIVFEGESLQQFIAKKLS